MFLQNLTQTCQDNPYFESHGCKSFVVPHLHLPCELQHNPANSSLPQQCFRLRHFAGTVRQFAVCTNWFNSIFDSIVIILLLQVTYSVIGFIEKNNDLLFRDLSFVMFQSESHLLKILFAEGNPKRTQMKRPASIATQFKISIGALMKNIQSKQLNFIKCIKPNQLKEPQVFEMSLVQHQIRYQLLLESAKLRKAGYFYRQDYENFLKRYKMLSPNTWPKWNGACIEGINVLLKDLPFFSTEYAFGRSKIFIKNLKTVKTHFFNYYNYFNIILLIVIIIKKKDW